ncbi:MAG: transglycosylase SLT domain-containing protein [Bdellovibrionales bacterium]|nr:transglycosylase SLT domain-containing protein [Bdellovibrionales bacterium]
MAVALLALFESGFTHGAIPPLWDAAVPSTADLRESLTQGSGLSDADLFWPEFAPNHLQLALEDRQERLSPDFRVPPGLEAKVRFWLLIYTFYSSQNLILYDDRHPELVYEVMDFRALAGAARNAAAYEILRERAIERRIKSYKKAFAALGRGKRPRQYAAEISNILRASRALGHGHSFQQLAGGLRGQTGQRDQVLRGMERFDQYSTAIAQIFEGHGIPSELSRVSLVESSFNPEAVSKAGAKGAWQFMLATAKEFMTVDDDAGIDERLSPLKGAAAAARLLRRDHRILGAWHLAVTAYNSGAGTVFKIPARERPFDRVGHALMSCKNPYRIGYAGRNYHAEFLAMLIADEYRGLFFPGLKKKTPDPAHRIGFVRLEREGTAADVARRLQVSLEQLLALNPDVLSGRSNMKAGFRVALPADKGGQLSVLFRARPAAVSGLASPPTG